MFWPCETRTSTCRNLATISSGLYRFLAITVLLDVKDIPQVGPLRWGLITPVMMGSRVRRRATSASSRHRERSTKDNVSAGSVDRAKPNTKGLRNFLRNRRWDGLRPH